MSIVESSKQELADNLKDALIEAYERNTGEKVGTSDMQKIEELLFFNELDFQDECRYKVEDDKLVIINEDGEESEVEFPVTEDELVVKGRIDTVLKFYRK